MSESIGQLRWSKKTESIVIDTGQMDESMSESIQKRK